MKTIGVGLFGTRGHQIRPQVLANPDTELIHHVDGMTDDPLGELDVLLRDDRIDVVSLCSARRSDQADHAIRALQAGKHVYAEKPCAPTEAKLDEIVAAAEKSGCLFHEMAGSSFIQPWLGIRELVASGAIGQVMQVIGQKSYPLGNGNRPQDESVDGGLTMQAGIHAVRFVEHSAGVRIRDVSCIETRLGNDQAQAGGQLRTASVMMMALENGGVATVVSNYAHQKGATSVWGNDQLRIFGTEGMIEALDGGTRTRWVVGEEDRGPVPTDTPGFDYFDAFVREIRGQAPMPISLEEELHPTRIVIRAKSGARLIQ